MPELPEVETVARDLRALVVGARIEGVRVTWERTLRSGDPAAFAGAVIGRTISAVGRRAKLVVLELDGPERGAITIHLKMTGQLFVVPADAPDDRYVRVTLELGDGRELRFRDIRKFGRIGLSRRDPVTNELVGELGGVKGFIGFGPEPLDPAFTIGRFRARLRGRRGRLKPLLMDQAFVAGVGNIYADEALWAARLHPLRRVASIRRTDELRLYRELRRILAEAVERRGSSVDDYTAPEGDGSMQDHLAVYQRTGEPCPRCGRPIRRIVVGARSTHLCTFCQRLPRADRPGAEAILAGLVPRPGRRAGSPHRGRRWTELDAPDAAGPAIGQRPAELARARTARTRRAAAARRAAARAGSTAGAGGPADTSPVAGGSRVDRSRA